MGKKLVIVESPAKAKTIGRYLGNEYKIMASVGHIRDLPSSSLGVDVNNNFKPIYINMRGKEKVIKELKEANKASDFVYIATDPDREGEAIAWHIAKALNVDPLSSCRITFNEITKKAVQEAISQPRTIDMDLVNAQQARRILDRLVGYELSPLLWSKIRKGLSAGRVQSVATKLVMLRDNEINAFVPTEYWNIDSNVKAENSDLAFVVKYFGDKNGDKAEKRKISNSEEANEIINDVKGNNFTVDSVKKGKKERNPFPPFTTSTLQQEASRRLGFTSKKTMSVAQQLYEGIELGSDGPTALVSYIRTDSVRISDEAVASSREYIKEVYGENYIAPFVRTFKNRNSAQDAHEAIRPTHFDMIPDKIRNSLSVDQYKLYKLIWDRFMATQMTSAKIDTVAVEASCKNHVFKVAGETVVFPGFLALYADVNEEGPSTDETKVKLPELKENMTLINLGVNGEQKFTTPPPHYTEATLIKALEENGIGRPSTYAPTISTILERKYVDKSGKSIIITELGVLVTELLDNNFKDIVDIQFTADMESNLDNVEEGKTDWIKLLGDFYPNFHSQVEEAEKKVERVKMQEEKLGEACPECADGELLIKSGRYGKFIACSNFPKCGYTRNIENIAKGKCPECGSGLLSHKSRKYSGKTFYTCDKKGANPDCGFISWDLPIDDRKCDTCGSYMVWRRFRGKSYPKCSNKECPTNKTRKKSSDKENDNENGEK
ncbi:MAG: type I DNA topoisomerase [Clostridia bacterium]|nr:type I DNA topoisomerase [Clostridia bacterium]